MKKMKFLLLILAASSITLLTGCNKDKNAIRTPGMTGSSRIIVKMTDAPAIYDSVNVEIIQVAVHFCGDEGDTTGVSFEGGDMQQAMGELKDGAEDCDSTGYSGWMELDTEAGMYNLLDLQNDVTAVLVDNDSIPSGHITQMRLVLGDNNYVVIGESPFDLKTPSAQQSGLKINLNSTFEEGNTYEIILDFDADRSIVTTGNGKYILKPVIKVVSITEV